MNETNPLTYMDLKGSLQSLITTEECNFKVIWH